MKGNNAIIMAMGVCLLGFIFVLWLAIKGLEWYGNCVVEGRDHDHDIEMAEGAAAAAAAAAAGAAGGDDDIDQ